MLRLLVVVVVVVVGVGVVVVAVNVFCIVDQVFLVEPVVLFMRPINFIHVGERRLVGE